MARIIAVVLARGGSKGIPCKNIIDFCGKPLIVWTIEQLQAVKEVGSIWVSSDSEDILAVSRGCGVESIQRPAEISGDSATSESAWLHALDVVENRIGEVDIVCAPQVTSPLRESVDVKQGLESFREGMCDSLFSCCVVEDFLFWEETAEKSLKSVNYDYSKRKRRQEMSKQYIENGSFYLFKPHILRDCSNRLGGKIGLTEMELWKMFEIDSIEDLRICEVLMKSFLLDNQGEGRS